MDLAQDTLLNNRYRIQYKLGQGGMGAVYLARDIALDHDVAVKANLSPAAESTNQFLREARLLAALRHPNLPRVTDYFILDGVQFLVMDYVPGRDLDSLLKEQGRQPLERVLAWAGQIGSALTYMHRQTPPVIHRDIKPGNIRLSAEGQAILVDFGIAKALPSDQVTETAVHGYTPGFAPPEQYGGMRTSAQSDQYALAATLYTLLAGQKPADAIQRALDQAVLTPLATYAPEVPPAVQAAIERALSVRPEMRFPSVDDFIRGLSAPAAEPIGMPPGSMYPPPAEAVNSPVAARRPSKPGWLIWAIIGSGALVGLAILAVDLLLVLPRLRGAAGSVPATLPAAVQVIPSETQSAPETETPIPPSETAAPPTATVTVTLAAATATEQLPTETRAAVAAAPIGQGGVMGRPSSSGRCAPGLMTRRRWW
jgi:serine/threonine protein kinase